MSYCRFSSDDFSSDVYVYEGCDGLVIHMASVRVVGPIPPVPGGNDVFIGSLEELQNAMKVQNDYLEQAHFVVIDHPDAGKVFDRLDHEACIAKLKALRSEGFRVPQIAIDALEEEAAEAHEKQL
ncbi:MAG: hypothetical protein IT443_11800 [Phycisphaeraceae bacterium]|nr:hypothetical protein [Phycisphaeraceae bacterium]